MTRRRRSTSRGLDDVTTTDRGAQGDRSRAPRLNSAVRSRRSTSSSAAPTSRRTSPPPTTRRTRRPAATTTRRRCRPAPSTPSRRALGEAVHLLEHGAVIGWTNDLSASRPEGDRGRVQRDLQGRLLPARRRREPRPRGAVRAQRMGRAADLRAGRRRGDSPVRRGVVRLAEDGRGRPRLRGRRARRCPTAERRVSAGRGTRAPGSRRARAAGRPRARRSRPSRAAPPRPWRGVIMSGSRSSGPVPGVKQPRPARSSVPPSSSSPPKTTRRPARPTGGVTAAGRVQSAAAMTSGCASGS